RGKRVPGVEINVQNVQAIKKVDKLDFHRVCLKSERIPYLSGSFFSSGRRRENIKREFFI
ncbi:hypothetical protein, partial [Peribacillus muralis]|uniref:hypothetical protein n=1 Tax=Peribacillus muralis TaxID=264697 RepID=UPI00366DD091